MNTLILFNTLDILVCVAEGIVQKFNRCQITIYVYFL